MSSSKSRPRQNRAHPWDPAFGTGKSAGGHSASPSAAAPPDSGRARRALAFSILLLVLATIGVYANSFTGPFVFDDLDSIVADNPTIRSLWPPWQALSPPGRGLTVSGRPLVNLSLAVNYAISGFHVWSYHVLNLAIHVLAVLTLFGVLRWTFDMPALRNRFGRSRTSLALASALIWAVHPLQTESVTYVVQRAESISGLFYLLTLYGVIRGAGSARTRFWYGVAVASCLAGMASKEVVATAPLVVLLYDRTFLAGSFRGALRQRRGLYVALAATWCLLGWLTLSTGWRGGTAGFGPGIDWRGYVLTQPGAIVHYLRLSVVPWPLVLDYGMAVAHGAAEIVPYAAILVLLLGAGVAAGRRSPAIGFAGAWFVATLAPTSSIIPIVTQTMAEHRMYLALAAVVVLAVVAAHRLWERFSPGRRSPNAGLRHLVPGAALAIVVIALGYATVERNRDYRSEISIWQDTVDKRPGNPRAEDGLGNALVTAGRTAEAIDHFERGLQVQPDYVSSHNNLGRALASVGRTTEAIDHYERAIALAPGFAPAHYNLGVALVGVGKTSDAIPHLERAAELRPDQAEVHAKLGIALQVMGRMREALDHQEQAALLAPDDIGILNNVAWLLATLAPDQGGDPSRAVMLAERANALTGDGVPAVLDTEAAAYAAAARFPEAIRAAEKALELSSAAGMNELAAQITTRLQLYRRGRAFHEPSP
jgi:protein O-mannosyl-transferase